MRGLRVVQMAAGLALLLVLFGASFSHASAGGSGDLVIHNRLCPTGYTGDTIFADCHDNPQDAGLSFTISGPESATASTDAFGNVTFADLTPGSYNVSGGVPGEFADTVVYCSAEGNQETLVAPPATATGFSVSIPADFTGSIICDWYNIPIDLSGGDSTPTPTPAAGDDDDVTDLPNTGTGIVSNSSSNIVLFGLGFLALGVTAITMRRRAMR
jgi:hypothetical protein